MKVNTKDDRGEGNETNLGVGILRDEDFGMDRDNGNEGGEKIINEGNLGEGDLGEDIEEKELLEDCRVESILQSLLFASDRPVSLAILNGVFRGTQVRTQDLRKVLAKMSLEWMDPRYGFTLEEVGGGYQIRTKPENIKFLSGVSKPRPFRLSGPALEVLSIVAYRQPVVKHEIDEIRGVESGHLLRALMEKNLIQFGDKSDLPGKPMTYETTRRFLEVFGLRNLKELPTLSQINEILPEGIGEPSGEGGVSETGDDPSLSVLSRVTDQFTRVASSSSYSQGEDELMKISQHLEEISTTSEYFIREKIQEQEKEKQDKMSLKEDTDPHQLAPSSPADPESAP